MNFSHLEKEMADLIKRIFVLMRDLAGSPRFLQSLNKFKLLDRLLFCRQPAPGLRLINSHLVKQFTR
jgi:hypothetical protein